MVKMPLGQRSQNPLTNRRIKRERLFATGFWHAAHAPLWAILKQGGVDRLEHRFGLTGSPCGHLIGDHFALKGDRVECIEAIGQKPDQRCLAKRSFSVRVVADDLVGFPRSGSIIDELFVANRSNTAGQMTSQRIG